MELDGWRVWLKKPSSSREIRQKKFDLIKQRQFEREQKVFNFFLIIISFSTSSFQLWTSYNSVSEFLISFSFSHTTYEQISSVEQQQQQPSRHRPENYMRQKMRGVESIHWYNEWNERWKSKSRENWIFHFNEQIHDFLIKNHNFLSIFLHSLEGWRVNRNEIEF